MKHLLNKHIRNIEKKTIQETNIPVIDTDFRYNFFYFKDGFLKGGILYKDFCKELRQYIITNRLFLSDGRVKCNEYLRYYCKSDEVSFFDLVKLFTIVLQ